MSDEFRQLDAPWMLEKLNNALQFRCDKNLKEAANAVRNHIEAGGNTRTDERAEMQAAIRELRELLDRHTDPMDRLPIIDQALENTKKWEDK